MTGSLSQEEVDALLTGAPATDGGALPAAAAGLGERERDTIGEVGNISMSNAATALSAMLGHAVSITTPRVDVVDESDVRAGIERPAAVTFIDFAAGLSGQNVLILGTREASVVADLMMGQDPGPPVEELSELQLSAVGEAMNQMMGAAATAMAELVGRRVDITAPRVRVLDPADGDESIGLASGERLVRVRFQLRVGTVLDTALMQLMPVTFATELAAALVAESSTAVPSAEPAAAGPPPPPASGATPDPASGPQRHTPPADPAGHLAAVPPPTVHPVSFPSLDDAAPAAPAGDIGLLLDVPLQVTVELGRTRLRIRNVLDLAPGSIIELDKLAGEPVDVLVNGKQIARGEVVVINEEFGVRITDVAHPATRLRGVAADG